jgi:hypothetical protein
MDWFEVVIGGLAAVGAWLIRLELGALGLLPEAEHVDKRDRLCRVDNDGVMAWPEPHPVSIAPVA